MVWQRDPVAPGRSNPLKTGRYGAHAKPQRYIAIRNAFCRSINLAAIESLYNFITIQLRKVDAQLLCWIAGSVGKAICVEASGVANSANIPCDVWSTVRSLNHMDRFLGLRLSSLRASSSPQAIACRSFAAQCIFVLRQRGAAVNYSEGV